MTVPATPRRAGPFNGNGVTTSFPFAFKVFAAAGIRVVFAANGAETALVLDSDYSVTLNGDQDASPGGTITYPLSGPPLAAGQTLTAVGNEPYTQELDLPSGGNFSPRALENALDRTTFQVQQLAEGLGRALTLPVSAVGADTELPPPAALQVIGWNADATALVNRDPNSLVTAVAYGSANADVFTGTGAQTSFTLSADPGNVNNLDVSISGVVQVPAVDYTWVSGTTLTFAAAPPNGATVLVRYTQALPIGTADAGAVNYNENATYSAASVGGALNSIRLVLQKKIDPFELLTPAEKYDVAERVGSIDVSAKFQQALDSAGIIEPRAGKYKIGSTLFVRGNTRLEGPSNYFFGDNPSPPGVPLVQLLYTPLTGQCLVTDAGFPMQVIRNLKITGPGRTVPGRTAPANYGVNVYATSFGRVENCYIEHFDIGVFYGRCTNNVFDSNVVSACNFGFRTQHPSTSHYNTVTTLSNNYVSDCDSFGYLIENSGDGGLFFNNSADACLGWGAHFGIRCKSLVVQSFYTELCQAGGLEVYAGQGLTFDGVYLAGPPPGSFPAYRNLRINNVRDLTMRNVRFEDIGGDYHLETIGTNRWAIDFHVADDAAFRASYSGGDAFRFFRQGGKRSLYEGGGLIVKAAAYFFWTGSAVTTDASIGVASITRSGTGVYTVNFSPAMASTAYMVQATVDATSHIPSYRIRDRTAGSFTIETFNSSTPFDPPAISISVVEVGSS